jgi:hypothetical protein
MPYCTLILTFNFTSWGLPFLSRSNTIAFAPITVRENREWKPAVAYCRYADDFVVVVKSRQAYGGSFDFCGGYDIPCH